MQRIKGPPCAETTCASCARSAVGSTRHAVGMNMAHRTE